LSPFFKSPMADFGYDVADYTDVDPVFGTLSDFDAMMEAANAHSIRVIVDFVPNHSSDEHPWFIASRSSRDNPKRDWYMWHDPAPDGGPPTNHVGFFQGSVWEWDEQTEQYYMHMFLVEQPDLNWRNPDVKAAMHDVLRFWMDRGVSGFRLDAITTLIKQENLRDLPEEGLTLTGAKLLSVLDQIHNQPEMHEILQGFRQVLDDHEQDAVLVGETNVSNFDELMQFYGPALNEVQLPQNLSTFLLPWDAVVMQEHLTEYYSALPDGAVPSIVFGNHDRERLATRYAVENARSAHLLMLTMWGVPTIYYGDELGMPDGTILPHQRQDPFVGEGLNAGVGRDPQRTPMQWDEAPNAGFTTPDAEPWLPIGTTFASNVAKQERDATSTLAFNRALLTLRRESAALSHGSLQFLTPPAAGLIAYERRAPGERMLVAVNFGDDPVAVDISGVSSWVEVVLSTAIDSPSPRGAG
ncbi:MAG: alpha-amylase family glycosyl hydrolase, partial [Chloroflexota bacterium]